MLKLEMDIIRIFYLFRLGLCRDCLEAQEEYIQNDGFSVLMRTMQADVEKLKIKASFFLANFCIERSDIKGNFKDKT